MVAPPNPLLRALQKPVEERLAARTGAVAGEARTKAADSQPTPNHVCMYVCIWTRDCMRRWRGKRLGCMQMRIFTPKKTAEVAPNGGRALRHVNIHTQVGSHTCIRM